MPLSSNLSVTKPTKTPSKVPKRSINFTFAKSFINSIRNLWTKIFTTECIWSSLESFYVKDKSFKSTNCRPMYLPGTSLLIKWCINVLIVIRKAARSRMPWWINGSESSNKWLRLQGNLRMEGKWKNRKRLPGNQSRIASSQSYCNTSPIKTDFVYIQLDSRMIFWLSKSKDCNLQKNINLCIS